MPFSIVEQSMTNTASTQDWLRTSRDMTISAYDLDWSSSVPFSGEPPDDGDQEHAFGTHLRETAATVKQWFGRK
jgi:hypothetical protein